MSQQAISVLDMAVNAITAITEYRCVTAAGAQVSTAGSKVYGISRRSAAIGRMTDVTVLGTAVAESGGAIAVGAMLAADAQGRVVTAATLAAATGTLAVAAGATPVTSTAANGGIITGAPTLSGGDTPQYIIGMALQSAAGAGEFIEVLIR